MKITYFLRDNGACGYYRCTLPLQTIAKNYREIQIGKIEKGDNHEKIEKQLDSDIFLIPRPSELPMLKIMQDFQKSGKKVVIDMDDNLFNVSPLSPHYQEWGFSEVNYNFNTGDTVKLWEHGKNIDLQANKDRLEILTLALETTDMVTVTTDILADHYRKYNDNIKVLSNCIDTDIWEKVYLRKDPEEIRIGWQGGSSHYEDISLLKEVFPAITSKYPKVKIVIMGAMFEGIFNNIPSDQFEFHGWVPTPAYPYKTSMLNYDIGLIPLVDNDFNRCKSPIKWIEFSSLGIPAVTSYVSPYKEVAVIDSVKSNGYFVENNDPECWIKAISRLVESASIRSEIGNAAEEYAHKHFDIKGKCDKWVKAYAEI